MTLETWLLYVATVLVFRIMPGPSHLLIFSTSVSNGFARSLATGAGDLPANAFQILLAGFGLAVVITSSSHGPLVVKWAGVAYRTWIGIRQILNSVRQNEEPDALPFVSATRL